MTFKKLAISDAPRLVFGSSPKPVHCGFDLSIGSGQVLPEVNFTLPALSIGEESWGKVRGNGEEHFQPSVATPPSGSTVAGQPGAEAWESGKTTGLRAGSSLLGRMRTLHWTLQYVGKRGYRCFSGQNTRRVRSVSLFIIDTQRGNEYNPSQIGYTNILRGRTIHGFGVFRRKCRLRHV